ncbi:MAG: transcriptional regulator [Comamonadaceae bacterium CG_4_9_14_0_8_um_filter_57_21]|nr:MAG: transcriptional regulator [Comamonadaceae bacterium CG_4_9_14_0_8_um_filter_57_21]
MNQSSDPAGLARMDLTDDQFETAAELFGVLAAPMRLRIIRSICGAEKNVSELLQDVKTTQPNISQHLNTLYKAGILGKRRSGTQIFYRIVDQRVISLCRSVYSQMTV